MFDLGKLGDLSKLAGEAKHIQKKQEQIQSEQINLLKQISGQMEEVIKLLKNRG